MNEYIERIVRAKNNIALFKNMKDDDIKSIVKNVQFIQYYPGETIIRQGEMSTEIYLVTNGTCEVRHDTKIVGKIEKNQPFGEFAPIINEPRSATIIAKDKVTAILFELNLELLEKSLSGYAIMYKNFVDILIKKIEKGNKFN